MHSRVSFIHATIASIFSCSAPSLCSVPIHFCARSRPFPAVFHLLPAPTPAVFLLFLLFAANKSKKSSGVSLPGDLYLGLLLAVDEYRVFGYITNTKVKLLVIVQECSQEVNLKPFLRDLHTLYTATVCNPFSDIGAAIQNPTFELNIQKVSRVEWSGGDANSRRDATPMTAESTGRDAAAAHSHAQTCAHTTAELTSIHTVSALTVSPAVSVVRSAVSSSASAPASALVRLAAARPDAAQMVQSWFYVERK